MGQLWIFFVAYLSQPQTVVIINGATSSLINVTSGVPQESILGPLLFLIYINDITSIPTTLHLFLYADDGKFLLNIRSARDFLFQNDLDSLSRWPLFFSLDFNVTKSFCNELFYLVQMFT